MDAQFSVWGVQRRDRTVYGRAQMHVLSRSLVYLACLAGLSGCTNLVFTKTTTVAAPAREATCTFEIFTTRPDRAFDELGIIDVTDFRPETAAEFRNVAQSKVCAAGGDAVLAEVNGYGLYVRGTVIRYRAPTTADATP